MKNTMSGCLKSLPHCRAGMLGFTLIELLVVVLIIGILAAIALPQYQKAVEKSRAAQALTLLKSVYHAQQAYHLASGSYAHSFDELAIDIPWGEVTYSGAETATDARGDANWQVVLVNKELANSYYHAIHLERTVGKYAGAGFQIYFDHNSAQVPRNVIFCVENKNVSLFAQSRGAYCAKVMKGIFIHEGDPKNFFSFDGTQWGN